MTDVGSVTGRRRNSAPEPLPAKDEVEPVKKPVRKKRAKLQSTRKRNSRRSKS